MALFNPFATKPAAKPAPKQQQQQQAPLADFAKIWEALAKQQAEAGKTKAGIPQLDAKQLGEALSKTRIAPQVSAQHLEAIQAGGDGAVAALSEMLNQTAQASVMQALLASQRMSQAVAENTQASITADLPNLLKDQMFQHQLQQKMPNLSNPAIAPLVESVRAGIAANNPSLTPDQLTEQAAQFFSEFTAALGGNTNASGSEASATETPEQDFFSILGIQSPISQSGGTDGDNPAAA